MSISALLVEDKPQHPGMQDWDWASALHPGAKRPGAMYQAADSTALPARPSLDRAPPLPSTALHPGWTYAPVFDFLDTRFLPSSQSHVHHSITYWFPSLCFLLKSFDPTPVSNYCLLSFLISNTGLQHNTHRMPFSMFIAPSLVFFLSYQPYTIVLQRQEPVCSISSSLYSPTAPSDKASKLDQSLL